MAVAESQVSSGGFMGWRNYIAIGLQLTIRRVLISMPQVVFSLIMSLRLDNIIDAISGIGPCWCVYGEGEAHAPAGFC